jgi:hypothetical protein
MRRDYSDRELAEIFTPREIRLYKRGSFFIEDWEMTGIPNLILGFGIMGRHWWDRAARNREPQKSKRTNTREKK